MPAIAVCRNNCDYARYYPGSMGYRRRFAAYALFSLPLFHVFSFCRALLIKSVGRWIYPALILTGQPVEGS